MDVDRLRVMAEAYLDRITVMGVADVMFVPDWVQVEAAYRMLVALSHVEGSSWAWEAHRPSRWPEGIVGEVES